MLSFLKRKPKVDPNRWTDQQFRDYEERTKYTPDVLDLGRLESWNIFIYDNLMKGKKLYNLLGDGHVRHGYAFTEDHFTVWHKGDDEKSTIIPIECTHKYAPFALLKGEIITVKTQQIINVLDKHYLNGVQFERKRVKLNVPFAYNAKIDDKHRAFGPFLSPTEAWMYVGVSSFWAPKVRNGSTLKVTNGDGVKTYKSYYDRDTNTILTPAKTFIPRNQLLQRYYHFTGHNDREFDDSR